MPSGYTSDIYDNKQVSFNDFVLTCARAFSPCIMQRDDGLHVPPKKQVPDKYYLERLTEMKNELKMFLNTPKKKKLAELADEILQKNKEVDLSNASRREEVESTKLRYTKMLKRVEAWTPPTPDHEGLKRFMIEQLKSSIEFDCSIYTTPHITESPSQHYDTLLEHMRRDIKYYQEEYDKEVQLTNSRNKWIDDLYNNLKSPSNNK